MILIDLASLFFRILYVLILVRVILSWIPGAMEHPAGSVVYRLTNPFLDPIRRLVSPVGGLDLSPLIAILLLGVVQRVVMRLLISLVLGL